MDSVLPPMPKSGGQIARGTPPKANVKRPARDLPGGKPAAHVVFAKIVDEATGKPISMARYEVVDEKGKVIAAGQTNYTGIVHHDVVKPGSYTVRVVGGPPPVTAPAAR